MHLSLKDIQTEITFNLKQMNFDISAAGNFRQPYKKLQIVFFFFSHNELNLHHILFFDHQMFSQELSDM